jgi:hypothetical protein
MVFSGPAEVREGILRHLSFPKIMGLLAEEEKEDRLKLSQAEVLVKQQTLMVLRSLLQPSANEVAAVLTACPSLIDNLLRFLGSPHEILVVQALYGLSSIASGNAEQKLIVIPALQKSLQLLQSTHSNDIKIAVINLLINIAFVDKKTAELSAASQSLLEMNLID